MKTQEILLSQSEAIRLIDYDPETGKFVWRERAKGLPGWTCSWNQKWAGRTAGTRMPNGYLFFRILDMNFLAHRIAWLYVHGFWPPHQIDHINMIRDDNRIANLRLATNAENTMNRLVQGNNRAGVRGAHFHKASGLWHATITKNGRTHSLGYYRNPDDAGKAYWNAAKILHGEFARKLR